MITHSLPKERRMNRTRLTTCFHFIHFREANYIHNPIFYHLNSNGAVPQVSLDINGGYGEQNLAGLGLSDDLLESIQGDSSNDNNDGSQGQSDSQVSSFGSSTYSARLNTYWEIDLWGKISNMNKYYKSNMLSQAYDLEYARISLKAQFIKGFISTININNMIECSLLFWCKK